MSASFHFQFVGNDLAIDFVNTRIAFRGALIELLENPVSLSAWFEAAGLEVAGGWTKEELAAALELRQAIGEALRCKARGETVPAAVVKLLNGHLTHSGQEMRLTQTGEGYALLPARERLSHETALGLLARRAAELLVSADPKTLKNCANEACVLIFKDASRGNKRRWCSMETCGNRAKASTHYRSSQA